MSIHWSHINARETGATLVEFMLGGLLAIALAAGLFDLSLALYRDALLTDATTRATRAVAASLGQHSGRACADLEAEANQKAYFYLRTQLGVEGNYSFQTRIDTAVNLVLIDGSWSSECFFCIVFGRSLIVTASSIATIEAPTFTCQ